jgi:SAM-dependent methyltransferase
MMKTLKAVVKKSPLFKVYVEAKRLFMPTSPPGSYNSIVKQINSYCGGLDGKSILELGCNIEGDFIGDVARCHRVREAVGINIVLSEIRQLSPILRLQPGDIRKMDFDDDHFDILISSSVFEHLHDFPLALQEMYRVLKPGGFVYSHYGPIWSGSYGHHLWMQSKNGRVLTYHNTILPPYCHLLMTPNQLENWLMGQHHPDAHAITDYVFNSPEQNHLMFSDYEKLLRSSPFEVIFLKGYDTELQQIYSSLTTAEVFQRLAERYPADRDKFLYDGITVLLRKSC